MLIKAISSFKIDDLGKHPLVIDAGDFADLRQDVAKQAVAHGAAVFVTIEEVRSSAKKTNKKSKSNDAEQAKE